MLPTPYDKFGILLLKLSMKRASIEKVLFTTTRIEKFCWWLSGEDGRHDYEFHKISQELEYLIVKWCKKPKPKRYLQFDTEILGTHASVFYRSVSHQSFLIQASIRSQWHQLHLYRCTRLSLENVGGGIYNADEVWPIAQSMCRTPHFRKEKLVAEVRQMPLVYSGESLTLKWYCSLE